VPPAECLRGGASTFCHLTGITAFAPNDVWAAGNAAWPGFRGPLLYHWDGSEWAAVRVGIENAATAFSEIAGSPQDLWAVGHTTGQGGPVAVRGDGRSWKVIAGLPAARLTDLTVDQAGHPWVLANDTAPGATLTTYGPRGWVDTPAPRPPNTVGISLHGITAVPGTPDLVSVGDVDLPGQPRLLRSVVLEYRS
jgi:hypothetical protein